MDYAAGFASFVIGSLAMEAFTIVFCRITPI